MSPQVLLGPLISSTDLYFSNVLSHNLSITHLCECHPRDDSKHDLLSFGGVGVLLVLLKPGLQGAGGLPGGSLGPRRVPVRILAVRVEALSGVDRQRGWVGARAVLQLILGALKCCREK